MFPGREAGRPISTSRLKIRLGARGNHGHAGRNTVHLDLAAQLPSAVLANLLGITNRTCLGRTSRQAHAAYAARVAARTEPDFAGTLT